MRCGNDPRARWTPGDRAAVAEFEAYLKRRATARLAVPCPWSDRARGWYPVAEDAVDTVLAAAELAWCEVHELAVSECPNPPRAYVERAAWGVPQG